MPSSTQDTLFSLFSGLFGGQSTDLASIFQSFSGSNTGTASSRSNSGGSIVSTILESAFGMAPLVSGLLGLFGGGDSSTPPPLEKYSLPPSISFDTADTPDGLRLADYGQSGSARAYTPAGAAPTGTAAQASAGGAPQITVNVQAMDARSFLDRSTDIAAAVREAMLNLNSINDVVNDL
jgi:hypothetical protein